MLLRDEKKMIFRDLILYFQVDKASEI